MATLKPMITKKFMAQGCNAEIQVRLNRLCQDVRRAHPGVWASELLKSLELLTEQLPELTEQQCDPKLTASWQPTLYEVRD